MLVTFMIKKDDTFWTESCVKEDIFTQSRALMN